MPDARHPLPFIDLAAQRKRLGARVDAAIARVVDHGQYIGGPEVAELEARLAHDAGTRHAVTCASGTDALLLPLMARGVGRGDAVIVPTFTFAATAEVVALCGATPVFADVLPDTYNIDPESLAGAVAKARDEGLRPRAVIPVDLFGQPADYGAVGALAREHDLWVIADAAQSFGATLDGVHTGALGDVAGTSFFPAKPLGCYGDGGAIFTDDDELAAVLRSLRAHGGGVHKYDNVRIGKNSRLDTLQAAVLLEKLGIFAGEVAARQHVAQRYNGLLADAVETPRLRRGATSVWAQYTVQVDEREKVRNFLKEQGVPTAVYYPLPLHRQTAYRRFPVAPGGAPVAERVAGRVMSLPMHPYLDEPTQVRIAEALRAAVARAGATAA